MTTRVERRVQVPAPIEEVWEFIADPAERARAISVVTDFTVHDEPGRRATWYVRLPIPFVAASIAVETKELERSPPTFVRFVGNSPVFEVVGEHELTETDGGTSLRTAFVVDGHVPGVETFFKRNLDDELVNLERALLVRVSA